MPVILTSPLDTFGVAMARKRNSRRLVHPPSNFVLGGIGFHTEVRLETDRSKFCGYLASRHIINILASFNTKLASSTARISVSLSVVYISGPHRGEWQSGGVFFDPRQRLLVPAWTLTQEVQTHLGADRCKSSLSGD